MHTGERQICDLIRTNRSLQLSRELIKGFGDLHLAVLLSRLADLYAYFDDQEMLSEDGGFYVKEKDILPVLQVSDRGLRRMKKKLKETDILTTERRGQSPPVEYYFVNWEKVEEIMGYGRNNSNRTNCPVPTGQFAGLGGEERGTEERGTESTIKDSAVRSFEDRGGKREIERKKNSKRKRTPNIHPAFEEWNNSPETTTHRTDTKRFSEIHRMLHQLREGTFAMHHDLDTEWLKKKGITIQMINKPWSEKDIRRGIRNTILAFKEGYEPTNKEWMYKSGLDDILYNPRKGKSFFIQWYYHPPRPLREVSEKNAVAQLSDTARELYRQLYDVFFSELGMDQITDNREVRKKVRQLCERMGALWNEEKRPNMATKYGIYNPIDMIEEYAEAFRKAYADWEGWDQSAIWGKKLRAELKNRNEKLADELERRMSK